MAKQISYGKSFQIKKTSQSKSKLGEKKCQKGSELNFQNMKVSCYDSKNNR